MIDKPSRSILDFRPVDEDVVAKSGAEPSLRELVFRYYDQHLKDEQQALKCARSYCEQIEQCELERKSAGAARKR